MEKGDWSAEWHFVADIEEVLGVQLLDDIMDVSKLSPESKIYSSSQAFEKLTTQLVGYDTSKISKADLIRR